MSQFQLDEEAIFDLARRIEMPEARADYLEQACGADRALKDRVAELLKNYDPAGTFLERPPGELAQTVDQPNVREKPGERIGPYKLLQIIGEGGFGVVYMAEQSRPVRRKVAIKVIKPGMDTKAVLARFEAERQALALMDHPNIARVLDGGVTDQGRPYFAMEYVKGAPLTEYCDNAKLSIKERLELFVAICKAVQHAHQKGVIHRDLKPSNILICLYDGKPVPKVIDFGLAKAMHQSLTEKTLFTAHGMMVGTPLYMSPEQAESNNLDVDTRTDVYSLGVILYELLTGGTPLEKARLKDAAVGEILRLIKEVEPPKPSTRISGGQPNVAKQRSLEPAQLAKSVSGDLDWVVMKALEKERGRRYETANGLAEDIMRHLNDEPVFAGAPTARYRFAKFVKRNRARVFAAGFVAAALVIGVIGTSLGLVWAVREKNRAEVAETKAINAQATTQRRSEQLAAVATFQAEQLASIDPMHMGLQLKRDVAQAAATASKRQAGGDSTPSADSLTKIDYTDLAVRLLQSNIFDPAIESIDGRFGDQPLVKAELLQSVASAMKTLGSTDAATDPQARALALRRERLGDRHASTLKSIVEAAELFIQTSRFDEAEALLAEAIESWTEVAGEDAPQTLRTRAKMAALLRSKRRYDEAKNLIKEVMERQTKLFGEDAPDTLRSMETYGAVLTEQGLVEEAEAVLGSALEVQRTLFGEAHPDTVMTMFHMATLLRQTGELERAENLLNTAMDQQTLRYGAGHPQTIEIMENAAAVMRARKKPREAVGVLSRVLESRRRTLGEDHRDTLNAAYRHAVSLGQANPAESLEAWEQCVAAHDRVLGKEHEKAILAHLNRAVFLFRAKRREEGIAALRAERIVCEAGLGTTHRQTIWLLDTLAHAIASTGRPGDAVEAVALREQLIARVVENPKLQRPYSIAVQRQKQGFVYFRAGMFLEASERFKLLADHDSLTDPTSANARLMAVGQQAHCLDELQQHDEAERLLKRFASIEDQLIASGTIKTRSIGGRLRDHYVSIEEWTKAISIGDRELADARTRFGDSSKEFVDALYSLGLLYNEAEQFEQAVSLIRESIRLSDELAKQGRRSKDPRWAMRQSVGVAFEGLEDHTEAAYWFGKASEMAEQMLGKQTAFGAHAQTNQAAALARSGEADAARTALEGAAEAVKNAAFYDWRWGIGERDRRSLLSRIATLAIDIGAEEIAEVSRARLRSRPALPLRITGSTSGERPYIASGYMGDVDRISLVQRFSEREGGDPLITRITLDANADWAGIAWLDPDNNWGERLAGHDLSHATRLRFDARAETENTVVKISVGLRNTDQRFPDSGASEEKSFTLEPAWKTYEIDLEGFDRSHITGGFVLVLPGTEQQQVIELDRVVIE